MTITLYKYMGEREKVDKSSDLILVATASGQFKAETNVLNPSLLLSLPQEGVTLVTDENGNLIADVITYDGSDSEILNFNYFYIAEFRRYYFLSSLVVSSHNLLIVSGEVDPLYSFKDQILSNDAFVERNEFTYSVMFDDPLLPLKLERSVTETEIDKSGVANFEFKTRFDLDIYDFSSPNIVVSIAYQLPIGGIVQGLNGREIEPKYFNGASTTHLYATPLESVGRLCDNLMGNYSNYTSFFKSIVAYPFVVLDASGRTPENMLVPKNDYQSVAMTNVKCFTMQTMSKFLYLADFSLPVPSSFLDLAPYSLYELFIPFYGWYELDRNSLLAHRLLLYYSINWEDGTGEVYLEDATANRYIFSAPVQIGVTLSLTSTNAKELQNARYQLENNATLGFVGNSLNVVASVFSKNYGSAANSALGAVGALADREAGLRSLLPRAQSSNNGASGALYGPIKARLRITKVQVRQGLDMSKFAHQYGRPLRDVRTLSTLSGFTRVAQVHLHDCDATDPEKAIITSSLLAGVIL